MASSQKIVSLCLCLLLASFGVMVDAGHHMMSGLFGGGHGGHGGIETLLVAGLLASLLRNNHKQSHHVPHHEHHAHHEHHGHHGGYAAGRAAYVDPYALYQYGLAHQHGYGM